jgi:putative DNA primase/helicase
VTLVDRFTFGDDEHVSLRPALCVAPVRQGRERPTPLPVRVEGIPAALRAERRWVVWKYEWREAKDAKPGQWTKTPYVATDTERKADSTDPTTWRPFADALAAYEDGKCDGIGFVLGDGWVGFDSDHGGASEHVELLNTYTEYSPSGAGGVHALCRGTKPGPKCRVANLELYDRGRYLTVTGHHVDGTPATVEERTAEVAALYARLFPGGNGNASPTTTPSSSRLPDDTLIARASTALKSGAKFTKLWAGDTTGYDSHSEADLALCSMLAFWTNRDAAQMDRLFRRSRLMRDKWNRVGTDLIAKAIAGTPKGYTEGAGLIITKASDVTDERLELAFGGRLLRGSFPLLVGPGDVGKGMFAAYILACLTTGAPFPGETKGRPPMTVMICATEDSKGRIKSRLRAAGANLAWRLSTRVDCIIAPRELGSTLCAPCRTPSFVAGPFQHGLRCFLSA